MDLDAYRRLRAQARRHAREAADADDLVQDALLVALEQGRELRDDASMAWLSGVMRHRVAMQARSAIRRRRRDASFAVAVDAVAVPADAQGETPTSGTAARALLPALPPAARRVAVLALHGLDAGEIRWILGLREAAFRQRLVTIRKALGALAPARRAESLALADVRDPARSADLPFGLVRRALKAALGGRDGLGCHDPDGHLLVLRPGAHVSPSGGN